MRGGRNSTDVKKLNRNRIFRYIDRAEKTSMPDIAAALSISTPTVLQIVKELKESGVIREVGEFQSTGGRKAKALEVCREIQYAVGIDITRNHITLVLTDLSEKVLKRMRIRKPFVYEDNYFRDMGEILRDFIGKDSVVWDNLGGAGISSPSIIDGRNYITYSCALELFDTPCDMFTKYIPCPSIMINDANAAALSECVSDIRPESMVYLSLSNTVGGAIVFRQEQEGVGGWEPYGSVFDNMYIGYHWHSGEFGHMVIHPGGRKCYCGKRGCVDAYCSALILARHTEGNLERFFQDMEEGNRKFRKIWEIYLEDLAITVDNLRMCFDCEVVLGGYVGSLMGPYMHELQMRVNNKNIFEGGGAYVRACKYQTDASALGAAISVIEGFIDEI